MRSSGKIEASKNFLGCAYPALLLVLGLVTFMGADFAQAQSRGRPPVGGRPGRGGPDRDRDGRDGRDDRDGDRDRGGRRRIVVREPRDRRDVDDSTAYYLVRDAVAERDCTQLSYMLDEIADRVTLASYSSDDGYLPPTDTPEGVRRRMAARVRRRLRSPGFLRALWNRVSDAYEGCGVSCFDQGYRIVQISAVGWCYAAIALDGLPGDGSWPRPPALACDHLQWTGCQSGYQDAASQVPGCRVYSEGRNRAGFVDAMNLDCRM